MEYAHPSQERMMGWCDRSTVRRSRSRWFARDAAPESEDECLCHCYGVMSWALGEIVIDQTKDVGELAATDIPHIDFG